MTDPNDLLQLACTGGESDSARWRLRRLQKLLNEV